MSQSQKITIVLCGQTTAVGSVVEKLFKPEIEVIHFIADKAAAGDEIARLLSGQKPNLPTFGGIGTGDYSQPPQAVVLGMAYSNEIVDGVRKPSEGLAHGVPWIVAGRSEAQVKEFMSKPLAPNYGEKTAEITKGKILDLFASGHGGVDGVHHWKTSMD